MHSPAIRKTTRQSLFPQTWTGCQILKNCSRYWLKVDGQHNLLTKFIFSPDFWSNCQRIERKAIVLHSGSQDYWVWILYVMPVRGPSERELRDTTCRALVVMSWWVNRIPQIIWIIENFMSRPSKGCTYQIRSIAAIRETMLNNLAELTQASPRAIYGVDLLALSVIERKIKRYASRNSKNIVSYYWYSSERF